MYLRDMRGLQVVDCNTSLPLPPAPGRAEVHRECKDEDEAYWEEGDERDCREQDDEGFDQEEVRESGVRVVIAKLSSILFPRNEYIGD